jgi:preprotein translocase subunit SecG
LPAAIAVPAHLGPRYLDRSLLAMLIPVILVIHIILAIALIGVVLLQKSEGGGMGLGGGGGMSGFMTGRSTANLLTRTTAILAAGFMLTSLVLALFAGRASGPGRSILDQIPTAPVTVPAGQTAPATPPAAGDTAPKPAEPQAEPKAPSVPLAK